jgi:hypothetical protein
MARKRALLELAVYAVLSGLGSFVTYVSMFGAPPTPNVALLSPMGRLG